MTGIFCFRFPLAGLHLTFMRLRIQTQNPLPELKAWFIPDVHSAPTTIYELKEALCDRVQTLKEDGRCDAQSLVLLLDDFELLDDTPFSAVRDGDLLCIKLSTAAQVVNEKGKYNSTQSESLPLSSVELLPKFL